MASIGPLNGCNSLHLQGTASCRKFSCGAFRGLEFSNRGARARRISFRRSCGNGALMGLSLTRWSERKGLMRVNCNAEGSEGKEEESIEDDEDAEDDALRATIKTSKKMLAKQKDLLQKIVANRKLVSSIESSVLNTDLDTDSYDGRGERSYLKADQTSTSEQLDEKYCSDDNSDTHVKTKLTGPPSVIDGSLLNGKRERETSSEAKFSVAAALGLVKESNTTAASSKTALPFLPKSSESADTKDAKLEDVAAAHVEDVSGKHIVDSEEGNQKPPPLAGINVMNVILVAAECAPWSKTGGLGDVAGALPKALARRGHRVMVVVPRYGDYAEPKAVGVHKRYRVSGQDMEVAYFHAYVDGVDFVFIESPIFRHRQNDIYGGNQQDVLKRMILFCKAAVEVPWHVPCGGACYGDGNLVFIANDWHTALLPVYLKAYYRDHGLMKYARCALVIHNIAHQGRGPLDDFLHVDLPEHYMDLFKLYDPVGGDHFNIFAAGLKAADRVVTVSHGYAWELKTSEGGWGLNGIINENHWKLQGIVNGIDTADWNPEVDVHLKSDGYTNYSLETLKAGKAKCKAALQRELGLAVRENVPIVAFIGRLDHQKGVDLIAEAMPWIVNQDLQVVMLGTGRRDLEDMLRRFEREHHDKVRGWVGFSVKLAHRITAGADILIMPSRFEPCGLNQLYAMAYGTVPVVHRVGGLRDTVVQFDPYKETGFGWAFDKAEAGLLIDALGNCLNTYWNYKNSWEGLQRRGMMQDLSWDNAAQHYEEVLIAAKYQW